MSAIAWIDFDERERQRAQRLMDFFKEKESRDELGLGSIRDSIADHLFPGTSTIQTRLRYMLFVPWTFQMLSAHRTPREIGHEAREKEISLIAALKKGHGGTDVIGSEAGAALKRMPSAVYWAGLESWGIRQFPGSIANYYASLPHLRPTPRQNSDEPGEQLTPNRLWHANLPVAPKNLLVEADFKLLEDEGSFLIDRLNDRHPESLITFLATRRDKANCDFIWQHPHLADFPPVLRDLVDHAETFSALMQGASLLYNLLLSQLRDQGEWISDYEEQIEQWRQDTDLVALRQWSLDSFWAAIQHPAHQIPKLTRDFAASWLDMVGTTRALRRDMASAANLVRAREERLKNAQSRFANKAARDRWRGASGAARLQYRWGIAKRHLKDLADAR